jgi:DNA-binding response OmpR family regulator
MQPRNILCIDDKETCHLYDLLLSSLNKPLKVSSAGNLDEAIDFVKSKTIDLYILEPYGREVNGIELCRIIRKSDSKTPIVFYSGMSREKDRSLALAAGANAFLVKGTDIDKFIETVNEFLN